MSLKSKIRSVVEDNSTKKGKIFDYTIQSLKPKLIVQMGYNSNKLFKEKYQQKVFENNFSNILKII